MLRELNLACPSFRVHGSFQSTPTSNNLGLAGIWERVGTCYEVRRQLQQVMGWWKHEEASQLFVQVMC